MALMPKTVAFAGTGDSSEANVTANLDDWLPEYDAEENELPYNPPILPVRVRRADKGLSRCDDWVTGAFKHVERMPLDEIVPALVAARDDEDDPADVYLVYVPGGDDDPHFAVVRAAHEAGIPVKDITAGLRDFEMPKLAEPEPPAEKPARGKARSGGETQDAESDSKASDEPDVQTPTEVAAEPAAASSQPQAATPAGGMAVVLSQATIEAILQAFALMAADIKASVVEDLPPAARPKVQTVGAWYHEEQGTYRPAAGRGRPRSGEKKVELTIAEAAELGLDFS